MIINGQHRLEKRFRQEQTILSLAGLSETPPIHAKRLKPYNPK